MTTSKRAAKMKSAPHPRLLLPHQTLQLRLLRLTLLPFAQRLALALPRSSICATATASTTPSRLT